MRSPTTRRRSSLLFALALAAPGLACSSSGSGSGAVGNVVIKDANNYSSTSSLAIPTLATAEKTDLTFTWDAITQDLLCHTAGSIDNVAFLQIKNMTQSDVEKKLAVGALNSNQVAVYAENKLTGADGGARPTSATLSKFVYYDTFNPLTDYVASSTTQYLALFTHGTTLGVGAQTMTFLQPSSTSTNTAVAAPNPCSASGNFLSFSAMLSPMAVSVPINGDWKLDWSEITKDNFGNALDFSVTKLDKVEVGFFQGKQPSDIQADFLNVEQDATNLYVYSVPSGQKWLDLKSTPTSGGTFPGFGMASAGTYAAAVLCTSCQVPAPVVFTILQPM
ncbi:MAG TPA: hypothetical protein VKZ18_15035 [Polyangia bacterium]|nr:hypothetical protein [Polyangia bacterium]